MKTTLGPRMREGDATTPSSFPRMRESRVVVRWIMGLLCMFALQVNPALAAEWVSLEKTEGAALFGEKCGMCHRAGGMGTGILGRRLDPEQALLENRRDLQPVYIETVVRAGFGVMFPISRGEVSDAQLQTIITHLTSKNAATGAAP